MLPCLLLLATTAAAEPGYFAPTSELPTLPDPGAIVAVVPLDADQDGDQDLFLAYGARIAADGGTVPLPDRLLRREPSGYVLSAQVFDAIQPAVAADALARDVDGDGDSDLVVLGGEEYSGGSAGGQRRASPSQIYRNEGGGRFGAGVSPWFPLAGSGIDAGDLDADGDPDLVLTTLGGAVMVYRNESTAVSIGFSAQGGANVAPSGGQTVAVRPRIGEFLAPGAPAVAVLYRASAGQPPGVALYAAGTSNPSLRFDHRVALPSRSALPSDLAHGELDPAAGPELVVAAQPGIAGEGHPSVMLRRDGVHYVVTAQRFGEAGARGVRVADVNADGRDDVVFATLRNPDRCSPSPRLSSSRSLLLLTQGDAGLSITGQCLGAHAGGARSLAVVPVAQGLPALVATGAEADCPALPQDVATLWRNGANPLAERCCLAEAAVQGGELPASGAAKLAAAPAQADPFLRLRDGALRDARAGQRLTARYYQHSPEIVGLMLRDAPLAAAVRDALQRWSALLAAREAGRDPLVASADVAAVDTALQRMSALGSPALVAAIAEERAAAPDFATLVDLPMSTFLATTLPTDRIHADGFEEATP